MPTEIVEQLEAQVVAMQFSLCSKQKQMQDYFQSSPRAPTPSKEPRARTPAKEARAPTPIKDVSFKTVADVTKDVSLVDSLDMDDMELESIDTTITSVATSALMKSSTSSTCVPFTELNFIHCIFDVFDMNSTEFILFKPTSHYFSVTVFRVFVNPGHLLIRLYLVHLSLNLLIVYNI